MSVKTICFEVLSLVKSEEDVFNKLTHVRHAGTGEEGLLLCSHYSKWPADLIPQATWLAGCFTPPSFMEDPRLVFGPIPFQTINWKVKKGRKGAPTTINLMVGASDQSRTALGRRVEEDYGQLDSPACPKLLTAVRAVNRTLFRQREATPLQRFRAVRDELIRNPRFVSFEWAFIVQALGLDYEELVSELGEGCEMQPEVWVRKPIGETEYEFYTCSVIPEGEFNKEYFSLLNEDDLEVFNSEDLKVSRDAPDLGYFKPIPI